MQQKKSLRNIHKPSFSFPTPQIHDKKASTFTARLSFSSLMIHRFGNDSANSHSFSQPLRFRPGFLLFLRESLRSLGYHRGSPFVNLENHFYLWIRFPGSERGCIVLRPPPWYCANQTAADPLSTPLLSIPPGFPPAPKAVFEDPGSQKPLRRSICPWH